MYARYHCLTPSIFSSPGSEARDVCFPWKKMFGKATDKHFRNGRYYGQCEYFVSFQRIFVSVGLIFIVVLTLLHRIERHINASDKMPSCVGWSRQNWLMDKNTRQTQQFWDMLGKTHRFSHVLGGNQAGKTSANVLTRSSSTLGCSGRQNDHFVPKNAAYTQWLL